jgi:hypothetical protein
MTFHRSPRFAAALLCCALATGCSAIGRSPPVAPPPAPVASRPAAPAAVEPAREVAPAPVPQPKTPQQAPGEKPVARAAPARPPAASPAATVAVAPKPPGAAPAAPVPSAPKPPAAPVATQPAAAPLDLASLETRLRETKAIGVFTKISLKNQVDDLLDQFRAYYKRQASVTLADLRRPYELLLLKVLSLLQDSDPPLARDIVASREAIWGILSDPQKFKESNLMAGDTP